MSNDDESQTHRPEDGWKPYVPRSADVADIRFWKSGGKADAGYLGRATFKVDGAGVTQAGDNPLEVWRKLSRNVEEWITGNSGRLDALETTPWTGTLYVKDSARQKA
jgi:hypothetical protein